MNENRKTVLRFWYECRKGRSLLNAADGHSTMKLCLRKWRGPKTRFSGKTLICLPLVSLPPRCFPLGVPLVSLRVRRGTEWKPKGSKQNPMRTKANRNRTEWKPKGGEAEPTENQRGTAKNRAGAKGKRSRTEGAKGVAKRRPMEAEVVRKRVRATTVSAPFTTVSAPFTTVSAPC